MKRITGLVLTTVGCLWTAVGVSGVLYTIMPDLLEGRGLHGSIESANLLIVSVIFTLPGLALLGAGCYLMRASRDVEQDQARVDAGRAIPPHAPLWSRAVAGRSIGGWVATGILLGSLMHSYSVALAFGIVGVILGLVWVWTRKK